VALTIKRPFTLLDSMVLIMAAAIGLALARYPLGRFLERSSPTVATSPGAPSRPVASSPSSPLAGIHRAVSVVTEGSTLVYPLVLTFTFAALVLRFKHPRPRLRRLFRQPGVVGCFAAILSFVIAFLILTPDTLRFVSPSIFNRWMFNISLVTSRMTGLAVASAWLAQALCGQWRPERTWVDRFGQVAAGSWIFAIVLEVASVWKFLL
jgi:hypothetical protein